VQNSSEGEAEYIIDIHLKKYSDDLIEAI